VAAVQVIEAETAIITPTLDLPGDELTAGEVILTGTGEPETEVEVMVDGQPVGTATVDSAGQWTLPIELSDAGDYQVNVQSVDASGQVVAASEEIALTVIEEEAAEAPTAPSEEGGQAYIVQLDDWLSKLADKFYGDIFAYPTIVEATNAKAAEDSSFATITNPDLIEIGQKLWIPEAVP
jgi:nucleoid-associated protein YgaU